MDTPSSPPSVAALTVLVVDDEDMVRRVAMLMLQDAGYRTHAATDEAAALAALDLERLDVAVVDLHLGAASGRDVLIALRQKRPGLPAVLMSGSQVGDALPADVVYLTKPFRQQALVAAVRAAVGG